ncbi:PilZ domain-containing protein [Sphingopyxis fribergensis]
MRSDPILVSASLSGETLWGKEKQVQTDSTFPFDGRDLAGVSPDEAAADRRNSNRYRTVCRVARVRRANDAGLWRVRNISDEGLMLAAGVSMDVGERLEIALSEAVVVEGEIVWTEQGCCGVAFLEPIDAATTLRMLAEEQRQEGYRALRLPIEVQAIVTLRDNARPIDLTDISQSGAGFRYDAPIEPGTELELVLPGSEVRRNALVRWSRGSRGGLWFTQPLDRGDLESLVRYQ